MVEDLNLPVLTNLTEPYQCVKSKTLKNDKRIDLRITWSCSYLLQWPPVTYCIMAR